MIFALIPPSLLLLIGFAFGYGVRGNAAEKSEKEAHDNNPCSGDMSSPSASQISQSSLAKCSMSEIV
jgi:hypothetical protein